MINLMRTIKHLFYRLTVSILKFTLPHSKYKDLLNLQLLLENLGKLRVQQHINHFRDIHEIVLSKNWCERNMEHLMMMHYYPSLMVHNQRNEFRSREIKIYSQNGEDGILMYIFSIIGMGSYNMKYINIGCGGISSNTANLVINFGWRGLEVDGSQNSIDKSIEFYKRHLAASVKDLRIEKYWLTQDNINNIVNINGLFGEIDLLSIDIDGNDFWIWNAIDIVSPRVVVIEYNASFGPHKSITVKYDENFDVSQKHPSRWYHGASLAALAKLGEEKGYSLICCDSNGVNAIFVKSDLLGDKLNEMSPNDAYYPHFQRPGTYDDQFDVIKNLEYVDI